MNWMKLIGLLGLLVYRLILITFVMMTFEYVMDKSLPFGMFIIANIAASLSMFLSFEKKDFD